MLLPLYLLRFISHGSLRQVYRFNKLGRIITRSLSYYIIAAACAMWQAAIPLYISEERQVAQLFPVEEFCEAIARGTRESSSEIDTSNGFYAFPRKHRHIKKQVARRGTRSCIRCRKAVFRSASDSSARRTRSASSQPPSPSTIKTYWLTSLENLSHTTA